MLIPLGRKLHTGTTICCCWSGVKRNHSFPGSVWTPALRVQKALQLCFDLAHLAARGHCAAVLLYGRRQLLLLSQPLQQLLLQLLV